MYNDPPTINAKRRAEFDQFVYENTPQNVLNLIKKIKTNHDNAGEKIEKVAQIIDGFAVWEHFATAGIVLFTSFFTYAIAYFRLSFGWLVLVIWYVSFIYSINIKRLRTKIKNNALKDYQTGYLDTEKETIEWGNQFLQRFWSNYEPVLSLSIKESVDAILDTIKLPGVDEIRLSKFTLGSLPPRIDGIKTFTETGDEVLIIDFDLSFTPVDEDSISKQEMMMKELRSLEIVLLTKVTLVPLTVSLKEVFINSKLRVQITFQSEWPMIKTIDLGCVTLPQIDFSLKPLGADIAKVAGLGGMIKDIVDNQLKNIIVNPNKYTIPLGEMMGENSGGTETAVGVLRVAIFEAKGLKNVDVTGVSDPCASISLAGNEVAKTRVIDNTLDPQWNDIHYIVIFQSTLTQSIAKADELRFEIFHINQLSTKSLGITAPLKLSRWISTMGIPGVPNLDLTDEETSDLIHEWGSPFQQHGQVWKSIYSGKKKSGSVRIDLTYYPVIQPDIALQNSVDTQLSGVVTLTIFQAKELGSGKNGAVEIIGTLDGKEVLKTPLRKRTANPNWGITYSFYVADISKADISFSVMNKGDSIGGCMLNVNNAVKAADDWYKLFGGSGKVRIGVKFMVTDSTHSSVPPEKLKKFDPHSVVRVSVLEATDLPVNAVELGKIDPYCKIFLQNRAIGASSVCSGTSNPRWNETFYTVCYSQKEVLKMGFFDCQNLSKDKKLGTIELPLVSISTGKSILVENLKITEHSKNLYEIWAPLYSKEEVLDDDLDILESNPRKVSASNIVQSVGGIFADAAKAIGNQVKTKQTGIVRLELQIFPITAKKVTSGTEAFLLENKPEIQPALMPVDKKQEMPQVLKPIESKTIESLPDTSFLENSINRLTLESGILRIRFDSAIFNDKVRPYIQVMANDDIFCSTHTPFEPSMTPTWLFTHDQCVFDLLSMTFSIFVRNQVDENPSKNDAILGFWVGDFVDTFLVKSSENLVLREYQENWTDFESLTIAPISLKFGANFYPVKYAGSSTAMSNCQFNLDSGVLHLDILKCTDLPAVDSNGFSDPYIITYLNAKQVHKTKIIKKTLNPEFGEGAEIEVLSRIRSILSFEVKDFNQFSNHETLGIFSLALRDIKNDEVVTLEVPLKGTGGKLFIRYLFEGRKMSRKLSLQELENNSRLQTEASTFGKFGRGIQSQVTGLGSQVSGLGSKIGGVFRREKSVKKAGLEEHRGSGKAKIDLIPSLPAKEKNLSTSNLPAALTSEAGTDVDKLSKRASPSNGALAATSAKIDLNSTRGSVEIDPPSPTLSRLSAVSAEDIDVSHDVRISILGGKELKAVDSNGTSDPYVRVTLQGKGDKKVHKTSTMKKNLNPTWDGESFYVSLNGPAVRFNILDKNKLLSSVPLGHVILDPSTLLTSSNMVSDWFKIQEGTGYLNISLKKLTNEEIQKRCENALQRKKTSQGSNSLLNFLGKKPK